MTLEELAVKHDYYCSESNYYSNEASLEYDNFKDFLAEFHDADVDMNLVFRWDLKKQEEERNKSGYYMQIFQMKQRKGIFTPILIREFKESDIPDFLSYIKPHMQKLHDLWQPLTLD